MTLEDSHSRLPCWQLLLAAAYIRRPYMASMLLLLLLEEARRLHFSWSIHCSNAYKPTASDPSEWHLELLALPVVPPHLKCGSLVGLAVASGHLAIILPSTMCWDWWGRLSSGHWLIDQDQDQVCMLLMQPRHIHVIVW